MFHEIRSELNIQTSTNLTPKHGEWIFLRASLSRRLSIRRKQQPRKTFPQKVTGRYPVSIERQVFRCSFDRQYLSQRFVKGPRKEGPENRLMYAKCSIDQAFFPSETSGSTYPQDRIHSEEFLFHLLLILSVLSFTNKNPLNDFKKIFFFPRSKLWEVYSLRIFLCSTVTYHNFCGSLFMINTKI